MLGAGRAKRSVGVGAEFCLRLKNWGKIKAKPEHRLHQNETGTLAGGRDGSGLPGSCSSLPALLASAPAVDFHFLLKSHEG